MISINLLKVMIVDDERLVRELMKVCIDWEEVGMTIVGESASALDAIEVIDKVLPDVIFTDICMPVMDGLELSKKILDKYPNIKIIILTGHEEFEYAKEGIKLGIADFLLKPINDDEIRKAALSIREKILTERVQTEEYDRIKEQLQQNMPFLREKVLNELLQSSVDLSIIKERTAYFGIATKDETYQVSVIEILNTEEADLRDEEKSLILKMRCLELTQRYFNNDKYIHVFFDNSQRIVVLCNESFKNLWEECETVKSNIIENLKCSVCIGIGNTYKNIDRIRMSYREACDALRYRFILGKNQVISFSDIYFTQDPPVNVDNDVTSSFCFYIKSGLKDKLDELIKAVFNELRLGVEAKEQATVFACNFVANILNVLLETGIKHEEVFGENDQPFETIFNLNTLPELKTYISNISFRAMNAISSLHGKKTRKIISDVREYIDKNFSRADLTLSEIAKKFYINLSYLSRIFKEETGLTFIDHLAKVRMDKAIKLLNETDKKAYEIAEEVGIADSHYFSVCFKKYTGMSINEYKKQSFTGSV